MELIKKYIVYIVLGFVFLIGIILIVIGGNNNDNDIVSTVNIYNIELYGDKEITIYEGDEYIEPGYRGYDEANNDLTGQVEVTNTVNTDKEGTYKVIYSLDDVVKERIVKVIKKEPGATYIHLYGDMNVFLYMGEEYVEKGYEVIDTVDGNKLKNMVKVIGSVNTNKAGVYKITYTVTNSSGITTTATRTVIVMDSGMTVSQSSSGYTNGNVKINVYVNDDTFDYLLLPNGEKVKERIYTYEASSNGTYKFVMYNTKGNSIEKSITISVIDKTKPSGSCSGSYKAGKSTINISATDDVGISRYEIEGTSYTGNQVVINKELTSVTINIYDKSGNMSSISCDLENKNEAPTTAKPTTPPTTANPTTPPTTTKPTTAPTTAPNFKIVRVDTTDLGCTVFYAKDILTTYLYINADVADEFHEILKQTCGYVNRTSWLDAIHHAGAYVRRDVTEYDYHSKGLAIDLNTVWTYEYNGNTYRPYSSQGEDDWYRYSKFICDVCGGKEDCKYNVNYQIYKNYFKPKGWCWGGSWSPQNFDPMHYEKRENGCGSNNINRTFNC